MPRVSWQARSDGLYLIDVALGSRRFSLMMDLGLIDPKDEVAFSLEPALYKQLRKAGELKHLLDHTYKDASGRMTSTKSGLLPANSLAPSLTFRLVR